MTKKMFVYFSHSATITYKTDLFFSENITWDSRDIKYLITKHQNVFVNMNAINSAL